MAFGKTRCGAEWVRAEVKAGRRRIALVGPAAADARNIMVEGASGILAISPGPERPLYEPSKRRLTWPNGAIATTYSTDEPERLRGPQHDAAWSDELGAWRQLFEQGGGHLFLLLRFPRPDAIDLVDQPLPRIVDEHRFVVLVGLLPHHRLFPAHLGFGVEDRRGHADLFAFDRIAQRRPFAEGRAQD